VLHQLVDVFVVPSAVGPSGAEEFVGAIFADAPAVAAGPAHISRVFVASGKGGQGLLLGLIVIIGCETAIELLVEIGASRQGGCHESSNGCTFKQIS
jgi:hypothetical protein